MVIITFLPLRNCLRYLAFASHSLKTLLIQLCFINMFFLSILILVLCLSSFLFPCSLHRSLMEQLRRLQALVMNTSNKPAQTGTCVLVRTSSVCVCEKKSRKAQQERDYSFFWALQPECISTEGTFEPLAIQKSDKNTTFNFLCAFSSIFFFWPSFI